jgi:hypothetical protein
MGHMREYNLLIALTYHHDEARIHHVRRSSWKTLVHRR